MVETPTNGKRWTAIRRAAGLLIIFTVIGLRASGLMAAQDASFLLGISCGLLGIASIAGLWRR